MWLLKILIALPVLTVFVLFLVQNNELVSLWPVPDLKIAVSVVYFVLFCLGYFFGRVASWSAYAPLRASLKKQKKQNKALSKEHEKLNYEHEKLNHQLETLQEENNKIEKGGSGFSLGQKIKGWFAKPAAEDK